MANPQRLIGVRPAILGLAGLLVVAPFALVMARSPRPGSDSAPPAAVQGAAPAAGRASVRVHTRRAGQRAPELVAADIEAIAEAVRRGGGNVSIVPHVSPGVGWGVRIDSVYGAGILGRDGFTIIDPGIAAPLGLRAGDRVVSVNGQPVWDAAASPPPWLLPRTHRDPERSVVEVTLERGGATIVETFRVR